MESYKLQLMTYPTYLAVEGVLTGTDQPRLKSIHNTAFPM